MSEESPYTAITAENQIQNGGTEPRYEHDPVQIQNGGTEPRYEHDPVQIQNGGTGIRYEDDPDTRCGIGSFQPRCLQGYARIGVFVGVYSISGLLSSSLTLYFNSQASMLEKQFGFSSAETGVLISCNEIGYLICVLFAGYFASKFHIPRVLGISTFLYGICGIVCALPYFLQDQSTYDIEPVSSNTSGSGTRNVPMCEVTNVSFGEYDCSSTNVTEVASNLEELKIKRQAYWLIAFGMLCQGIGKSVRSPLIAVYIDDAVDKRKTGFYMGIIIGTALFGPALAYLLGGVFSNIYVNLQAVDITPKDPRWIGAWWLGFVVFGGSAIVFSLPTMCFPRKLRSKSRRQAENGGAVTDKEQAPKKSYVTILFVEVKGFLSAMIRLFKNPVYSLFLGCTCVTLLGVAGVMSFMPKYIAAQYSIPLWKANIILAISSIAATSSGTFVGGVLTRRLNMSPITTCKLIILLYLVNIGSLLCGLFLGCDQPVLVGDNMHRSHVDLYSPTNTTCIQDCICDDEKYFPVCGDDGVSYYSPCHAGCTDTQGIMGFTNCTCIPTGNARAGLCDQGCSTNLYMYGASVFVTSFVWSMQIVPKFIAMIRCVDESDRAVGSATTGFLSSVIGWMPGPMLFGLIIDRACLLWEYTCGERQSCLLYDIGYFRTAVHAYVSVASTIAMMGIVVLYLYFRIKDIKTWNNNPRDPQKEESANKENSVRGHQANRNQ